MRRRLPVILGYHAFSADWSNALSIDPSVFERQLLCLARRGMRSGSAGEVAQGQSGCYHVTFDDGFRSVLEVVPILERLRIPSTLFICTSLATSGSAFPLRSRAPKEVTIGWPLQTLTWDALRELQASGMTVGSHSVTHPHLSALSDRELQAELIDSKRSIEDQLNAPCRFFAYPYGDESARVRAAIRAAGYDAAFGAPGNTREFDPFSLPRVIVVRKDGRFRFAVKTSRLGQTLLPRLARIRGRPVRV